MDFDPVKAKAAGLIPGPMDSELAALFPDSMTDSELGPIPSGWKLGEVRDWATLAKGSVNPGNEPKQIFSHFSLPAFDEDQMPSADLGSSIKSNKTRVPSGAVLLSKLNPRIPRIWFVGAVEARAVCSTEFLPWLPVNGATPELVYGLFTSPRFIRAIQSLVTGTSNSHQRVKPDMVAKLPIVMGHPGIHAAFTSFARPLLSKVVANRRTRCNLTALRTELLPPLVTGKLNLPGTQQQLEVA